MTNQTIYIETRGCTTYINGERGTLVEFTTGVALSRGTGYDDAYFHKEVIPAMRCSECGKSSDAVSSSPDVPEGVDL